MRLDGAKGSHSLSALVTPAPCMLCDSQMATN